MQVASRAAERLKTLGNDVRKLGNSRKMLKLHKMLAYCPVFSQSSNFVNSTKKFFKNGNYTFSVLQFHTKTRLKCFPDCLWKEFSAFNFFQTSLSVICFTISVTLGNFNTVLT